MRITAFNSNGAQMANWHADGEPTRENVRKVLLAEGGMELNWVTGWAVDGLGFVSKEDGKLCTIGGAEL